MGCFAHMWMCFNQKFNQDANALADIYAYFLGGALYAKCSIPWFKLSNKYFSVDLRGMIKNKPDCDCHLKNFQPFTYHT
jgi:hypothetical protein